MVIQTMKKNAEFARRLIVTSITMLSHEDCTDTVKNAKVFYYISQSNGGCCFFLNFKGEYFALSVYFSCVGTGEDLSDVAITTKMCRRCIDELQQLSNIFLQSTGHRTNS